MEGVAKQGGSQIYEERRKGWDTKKWDHPALHPCRM